MLKYCVSSITILSTHFTHKKRRAIPNQNSRLLNRTIIRSKTCTIAKLFVIRKEQHAII